MFDNGLTLHFSSLYLLRQGFSRSQELIDLTCLCRQLATVMPLSLPSVGGADGWSALLPWLLSLQVPASCFSSWGHSSYSRPPGVAVR